MNKATLVAAALRGDDPPHRPSSTPIYQTATFEQESPERFGRYDYARSGNPTRDALEGACARLEGAAGASAFASGLAALATVLRLLRPGETIVAHEDLYGGTQRLLGRLAEAQGIDVRYADLVEGDADAWERAIPPAAKMVLVESVSNPLWRAPDIRVLARLAHQRGALLAVDATAMSPWWQRPVALGADLVVHSATKLLSGHGDVTAGIVCSADAELRERIAFLQNAEGAVLGPFDAWLLLRGMKTLGIRLDRQAASAMAVARWLDRRRQRVGDIDRVHFIGLCDHPDHDRHRQQSEGPGLALSFETGDATRSAAILRRLERFSIAVSFGSVDSTASLPCFMSHASVPAERRSLPSDLIRLSIGIEDPDDLISDLEQGLDFLPERLPQPERPAQAAPLERPPCAL